MNHNSSQFNKKFFMTETLYDYMVAHSVREHPLLQKLRSETLQLRGHQMISPPEQGQLLQLLVRLTQPQKLLEIGIFTGYSTLCMALSSPKTAHITALDINNQWHSLALHFWQQAGVEHKITPIFADAHSTMAQLVGTHQNSFDFVFIDADKEGYLDYYEKSLQLLKPGGLMAIDNVFSWGLVANEEKSKRLVQKMRIFNKHLHADPRIHLSIIPMGDGLTLVHKI